MDDERIIVAVVRGMATVPGAQWGYHCFQCNREVALAPSSIQLMPLRIMCIYCAMKAMEAGEVTDVEMVKTPESARELREAMIAAFRRN